MGMYRMIQDLGPTSLRPNADVDARLLAVELHSVATSVVHTAVHVLQDEPLLVGANFSALAYLGRPRTT